MISSASHHSTGRWPTELFLLDGGDRRELLARVRTLSEFIEANPDVCLRDLAYTLSGRPLGERRSLRLALIAGTVDDLRQRLGRAETKLADPECRQIRDVTGVYFTEEPLGSDGQVAFLFPGEGAPYLGMLEELRAEFPEVAGVVDHCDELQAAAGEPPLSRFLTRPDDADERAGLERDLGGLANTMFSVLMVNWALYDVLRKFGVRADAMGGHSAGELGALWSAQCFGGDFDPQIVADSMRSLEKDPTGVRSDVASGVVLLAVGASREKMQTLTAKVAGSLGIDASSFFLAMDNCPHQTVVIGPPAAMAEVEAELGRRKLMHERLPFDRPYHTPLFEPFMGPLTRMFDGIEFRRPTTKLYSCTSAAPFPDDPAAIRELALAHWRSPVEFTGMIRRMHEDGVRIFIEVGPRGNLTAFTEDILRGRPFLAVPADTPRRPGRTQLNHLLGQLAVHHVALDLAPLYAHRDPQAVEWMPPGQPTRPDRSGRMERGDASSVSSVSDDSDDVLGRPVTGRPRPQVQAALEDSTTKTKARATTDQPTTKPAAPKAETAPQSKPSTQPAAPAAPAASSSHPATPAANMTPSQPPAADPTATPAQAVPAQPATAHPAAAFQGVMDQFLGLQQDVMQGYLQNRGRRHSAARQPVRRGRGRGAVMPQQSTVVPPAAMSNASAGSAQAQTPEHVTRPSHAPSHADAAPVPGSLPIGPVGSRGEFPMIDEIRRHVPLKELVVRRVLDLHEDHYGDHHTVGGREVSYVYPERNGQPVVPMTFSLEMMAEAARLLVPDHVVTSIENVQLMKWLGFDEDFPPTIELSGRVVSYTPEAAELEVRIRDLGHNPADDEKGAATSIGTIRTAVRYPEPPPVPDFPLTNERPCRVPLDILYKNLFHGPMFQGTMSLDRFGDEGIQGQVRVLPRHELFRSTTDPQFVLDPVLMDVGMHPLAGWHLEDPDQTGRILLPFEVKEMRFYGPRPTVGTELTSQGVIVHQSGRRFTHAVDLIGPDGRYWCQMHGLKYWRFYLPFGEFNFHGPKDDYFLSVGWPEALPATGTENDEHGPTAWCVKLEPPRDLLQPGLMMATARVLCTREELATFRQLTLPDLRKVDWLFGRMAAKDAARLLWRHRDGERMVPADIHVEPDEHGRPIASPIGRERPAEFPHVSIAHVDGLVVGAASSKPIGIDLEIVREREPGFEAAAFTEAERGLLGRFEDRTEAVIRFWCAKEAAGKALGRGLTDGPRSIIITDADPESGLLTVVLAGKLAETFPALGDTPLAVHTLRDGEHVAATCLLEEIPACR